MKKNIAIIGAGVIGLTSGIRLLEKGADVTIFARDIDSNMSSVAAPAIWSPYKALPEEAILKWAEASLLVYQQMDVRIGVFPIDYFELYHQDLGKPLWTRIINDYRDLSAAELPANYVSGYQKKTYVIDTRVYFNYLRSRFSELGGKIFQKEFSHLHDVDSAFQTIVNCSGVGSNQLVPDEHTFPIRGQYLIVEKVPALKRALFASIDENNYILIIPRTEDCYIGGTTIDYDWSTEVDPDLSKQIFARAQKLEPMLEGRKILRASVGLRPGRDVVRLEAETLADSRNVIHNYGHGGAGYTVSWGCADEVVKLVQSA